MLDEGPGSRRARRRAPLRALRRGSADGGRAPGSASRSSRRWRAAGAGRPRSPTGPRAGPAPRCASRPHLHWSRADATGPGHRSRSPSPGSSALPGSAPPPTRLARLGRPARDEAPASEASPRRTCDRGRRARQRPTRTTSTTGPDDHDRLLADRMITAAAERLEVAAAAAAATARTTRGGLSARRARPSGSRARARRGRAARGSGSCRRPGRGRRSRAGRGSCPAAPARARRAPRPRGRACRPRGRACAAPRRSAGSVAWYSRAEIGRSSTASSRQRKHGPCRRASKAQLEDRPGRGAGDRQLRGHLLGDRQVALAAELERLELDLALVAELLAGAKLERAQVERGHLDHGSNAQIRVTSSVERPAVRPRRSTPRRARLGVDRALRVGEARDVDRHEALVEAERAGGRLAVGHAVRARDDALVPGREHHVLHRAADVERVLAV